MQYTLLLAAAALAHARGGHRHLHDKRQPIVETVSVVDVDVVTVTEYMTASVAPSVAFNVKNHRHSWQQQSSSTKSSSLSSSAASTKSSSPSSSAASTKTSSLPTSAAATVLSSARSTSASTAALSASSSTTPIIVVSPIAYSSTSVAATTFATSSTIPASSYSATSISSTTSVAASSTGISVANLTPNGKKAGLSGYIGIQSIAAFSQLAPYISWYSDYTAVTPDILGVKGVGMLWGAGDSGCTSTVTDRLAAFKAMITVPDIMFGFYEPDCSCDMSADMSVASAASSWDTLIKPLGDKGAVLGSPSMCKQKDEDFLTPFNAAISRTWDVTSIHINKPNVSMAILDVEYYVQKYGKPVWVTEFACVNDQPSWQPCTDQTQINTFINEVVAYFEGNSNVVAYGPSNGEGLGTVWPLTDSITGALTTSGKTYLNAIKGL